MIKRKFIFILLIFIVQFQLGAQKSEHWVKASLLYQLCSFIEWPENINKDSKFTIALLDANTEFYNELNQIAKSNKTIHGKEIEVQIITHDLIAKEIHVLVIGSEQHKNAELLLEFCKANSILLVSDQLKNNLVTVINFYYNTSKKAINFEVNKQNLIQSKLNYKDDILLYGGNLVDVKELYHLTNKLLEQEAAKVKEISQQIAEQTIEIQKKNKEIALLNNNIKKSNTLLNEMVDSTKQLKKIVDKWKYEILVKQKAITAIENDYQLIVKQKHLQESVISDNEKTLKNLDKEINEREKTINQQSIDIEYKNTQLEKRDRALFLFLILGIVVAAVGIFFIYAYRTKNRYNKLLEIQVEERTYELRKSERDYREVFNGVTDYIFVQDEQGKILTVNEPMLKAYGYTKEEITLIDVEQLSDTAHGYTKEKANELYKQTVALGQQSFDWKAKRKNGETFWVIVTLRHTTIGGENRLLAVVRDNDANKKNEIELEKHRNNLELLVKEKTEELVSINEELNSTNEELYEKSNIINNQNIELRATLQDLKDTQTKLLQSEKMASLGVLTAGVAHEINNPLNYIMGAYVGLERIHSEKSYEQNQSVIDMLLSSLNTGVERASNIVTGLNRFSRNSQSLDEECDIHDIIDNCLNMLNNKLKHRIVIDKKYTQDNVVIKGNVGNLHQVFINILGNAEQAIQNEGNISIKTSLSDSIVEIIITDNGIGISPENIKKITDPFFTTKDPGQGTGLGLSITYNIIQDHKGSIEFESEPEKGTTVKILLPNKTI